MSGIEDQKRLEELRQRLYQRGNSTPKAIKHKLTDISKPVATTWSKPPQPKVDPAPKEAPAPTPEVAAVEVTEDIVMPRKAKRTYRLKIVALAVAFFVVSVAASSVFLIGGGNTISGENITLAVTGPFSIGGGETIPLQVGVTNANAVSIEAATLIVEYPQGTRSVDDATQELFVERLALDTVASGETLNIPLRAVVFGEENQEKEINVSIEYRVRGSNALFFKEADPLRFKIGSSPIRLAASNLKKISSGQETDVTLTITSNSPTPLTDILVKADYPIGFDFTESTPDPTYAQNMWLIDTIEPESAETVTITGVVIGSETDTYAINVAVGVPTERDPQNLASVFTTEQIEFEVEEPFIDIDMRVDGQRSEEVIIEPEQSFTTSIDITNTLDDTIYDGEILITLAGNAVSQVDIDPRNGYYNSSNNTISWDVASFPALAEIKPGDTKRVNLTIEPAVGVNQTPQIAIDVAVKARRVQESRVAEQLTGTASAIVKIVSDPVLFANAGYNISGFVDTGSIPPRAEQQTTYTMSFLVQNGSNDITDTEVSASVPPYVTWLDVTGGSGTFSFNSTTRVITWLAGDIDANGSAFGTFQVGVTPSKNQIGNTLTILGGPQLKATDRFTGSVVRSSEGSVGTELSPELGFDPGNGRVVQ